MSPLPREATNPQSIWKLIERDYTLRLSLVAPEWAAGYLKAWNAVFAEGRKRGNSAYCGPALVEMEIADAEKRAEWSYRTCCEIWELQGRPKCRSFFRAIFELCLQPMFSACEGCFRHELEQRRTRTGIKAAGNPAIGGHMKREMDRLRARWNTLLEIAARDAEHEQRREQEQASRFGSPQAAAPTMAGPVVETFDSSFTWKELERRFREIQSRTSPDQNVTSVFFRTEWDSGSVEEEWVSSGNVALRKDVEYLGSIAARKLGTAPGNDPHKDWLDRIRVWVQQTGLDEDRNYSWPSFGSVTQNGMIGKTESMSLENLAELSAKFCMNLIARGTPELAGSQGLRNSEIAGPPPVTRRSAQKPRKTRQQLHRMGIIFGAIQSGVKGTKYCSALDARRLRIPVPWREEGCPETYVLAYREPQWRKRIQDEKSRYTRQYRQTPGAGREAIIQGESATRRTRH